MGVLGVVFFMLFSGIITGKLFDEYGPAVPLAIGSFLHVFGIMMISLSTEYYQILLSQSVCSGIGASLVFFPSSTCVSNFLQLTLNDNPTPNGWIIDHPYILRPPRGSKRNEAWLSESSSWAPRSAA